MKSPAPPKYVLLVDRAIAWHVVIDDDVILCDVEEGDLLLFFQHQRDPDAAELRVAAATRRHGGRQYR
jgi:hypothetical protein